jgi:Cysteine-rich secretory protein family
MWRVAWSVGIAVVSGCGVSGCGASQVPRTFMEPESALIAELLAPPITVALEHPVAAYGEPGQAPPSSPLAEGLRAAMQELAGSRAEIAGDPRLDVACRELSAVASRDAAPRHALVEFVLRGLGIIEPAERVVIAWDVRTPDEAIAALRAQLDDAPSGYMRLGAAMIPDGPAIAIAVRSAGIVLAPTPRALPPGGRFELVATLERGLAAPHVSVVRDDGSLENLDVAVDDATLRAPFACGGHTGRQWLQIDAVGPGGRLPRAQVPILCGDTPPAAFVVEPAGNVAGLATAADMERRLTSIINRERTRAKLPPLRTDPRVASSARRNSERVRDARGLVGGGPQTPMQRLASDGVHPRRLLENFLEADSVAHAAEELMNHAGYRARLVSEDVTEVGVGVAIDDAGHLKVTITYVLLPPRIDASAAARRLTGELNTLEESETDHDLAIAAQRFAEGLALGWKREDLWPQIYGELAMFGRYGKLNHAVLSVVDPARFDPRQLVRGRPVDKIGIGVAQSARYSPQGGVVWVVAFLGRRHSGTFSRSQSRR